MSEVQQAAHHVPGLVTGLFAVLLVVMIGSLALEDRPHGEISSCGVGSVFFGTLDDADYDGTIYVDNIEVVAYLFRDGFEAGDLSEWSSAVGGAK